MKILVDKAPQSPSDCRFSNFSKAKSDDIHVCSISYGYTLCKAGEDGWKCPVFASIEDMWK